MTWRYRWRRFWLRQRARGLARQGHPFAALLARGKWRELDRLVDELEW